LSYPAIWLAEIVAGAPFFFGEADADGLGVSPGDTLALGLAEAEGDSSGDGEGVGEALRFFFLLALDEDSGEGLGDDFFFFGDEEVVGSGVSEGVGVADVFFFFGEEEVVGSGVSEGVGVADIYFFFGDGDFSGVSLGFGVGDFSAVVFFFVCFRGVGVGVGSKIFFSFVPIDSSAGARTALKPIDARTKSATAVLIVRRIKLPAIRSYFASSARTALFSRMPASRFSSGKFSLGEWARQSGSANPNRSVSTPRILRNCETIGMLPPSRIVAGSLPSNAAFKARCAASPNCECGSVRYHGPL
jgi:hypothetical protein